MMKFMLFFLFFSFTFSLVLQQNEDLSIERTKKLELEGYKKTESYFRGQTIMQKQNHKVIFSDPNTKYASHVSQLNDIFEENHAKNPPKMKDFKNIASSPDDYFEFIPSYVGSVIPGKGSLDMAADCFEKGTASAVRDGDKYRLEFSMHNKKHFDCDQGYLIATVDQFDFHYFIFPGNETIDWMGPYADAVTFDMNTQGFRIFKFHQDMTESLVDVFETVQLFLGAALFGKGVLPWTAEDNVKFLKDHANITMNPRSSGYVDIKDYVTSGDFLGVIRLDGLDPTLAWGMGSQTGHTTIVLEIDGEMYVCESTNETNYWPYKSGIQKTPYDLWMKRAQEAKFNVVHLPMSEKSKKIFNHTKAVEYFKTVEGLPYGFHNMLFGWIDTPEDNYPPPLDSHLVMLIFSFLKYLFPEQSMMDIGEQAFNHRLGTKNLTTNECFEYAAKKGISFTELATIPEQDSWIYENPKPWRNGPAMVCDVFVSAIWKAGGLFGDLADEIQVTEFTNWDAYSLDFFNKNSKNDRPQVCKEADPELPYCQIMGDYTLTLKKWNTVVPYKNMREKCGSLPPSYYRAPGC